MKPERKPRRPHFSSGPCAKRPGWNLEALRDAAVGRSHRAKIGKERLNAVIERSKAILRMPADYRLGIVAGSDTGAVEMALWSLLGARGVDVLAWESFGSGWVTDITKQLKLDARVFTADYGELPDLSRVDFSSTDSTSLVAHVIFVMIVIIKCLWFSHQGFQRCHVHFS